MKAFLIEVLQWWALIIGVVITVVGSIVGFVALLMYLDNFMSQLSLWTLVTVVVSLALAVGVALVGRYAND